MEKKRPNISKSAFWSYDVDFDNLDFNENAFEVLKQIIHYGSDEEYLEILRFYGKEKVLQYIAEQLEDWEERKKLFRVSSLGNETLLQRILERKSIALKY